MSVLVARKLGLLARRVQEDKDDSRDLLTGEGLKKFGISLGLSKRGGFGPAGDFGGGGLGGGLGLMGLPAAFANVRSWVVIRLSFIRPDDDLTDSPVGE